METLLQDIRFAVRVLKKAPTFTLVAVITIGLAIGATTSMFSVIDATLIRPLPFSQPDQLVMLYLTRSENSGPPARFRWAYPRFLALKQNGRPSVLPISISPASSSRSVFAARLSQPVIFVSFGYRRSAAALSCPTRMSGPAKNRLPSLDTAYGNGCSAVETTWWERRWP
jgi:putative ABC transport system permease protein